MVVVAPEAEAARTGAMRNPPPGWSCTRRQHPGGTRYVVYRHQASGKTARSIKEAWRLEDATGQPAAANASAANPDASPALSRTPSSTSNATPVVAPLPAAPSDPMEAVRRLLTTARLEQYAAAFDEAGYDDISYLLSIAGQAEALRELASHVGLKPGHAARFACELREAAALAGGA